MQMDFDALANVVRQTDSLGTVVPPAYGVKTSLWLRAWPLKGSLSNAGPLSCPDARAEND